MLIKIGTRASTLACIQVDMVIQALRDVYGYDTHQFEIVKISTKGDMIKDTNLRDVGGKGLFVSEIEKALLDGDIDIAVHSLKDVPSVVDDTFAFGAMLPRTNPFDCMITRPDIDFHSFWNFPQYAVIGTSSPRRIVQIYDEQIWTERHDLIVKDIRGNIDTRIKKLCDRSSETRYDALMLACAGIERLLGVTIGDGQTKLSIQGHDILCYKLGLNISIPASTQGVICVQTKSDNTTMLEILQPINDIDTMKLSTLERACAAALEVTCHTPVSVYAYYNNEHIKVKVAMALEDSIKFGYEYYRKNPSLRMHDLIVIQRNENDSVENYRACGSNFARMILDKRADY